MEREAKVSEHGTLAEQVTMSIEDAKALLKDNRTFSVAFLAYRLRDHEEEVRKRFLEYRRVEHTVKGFEEVVKQMSIRLDVFAVKWQEMREELDQMKAEKQKSEPNAATGENCP